MTQSLRDFLNQHVHGLRARQAQLRKELGIVDQELAEALLARSAIGGNPDASVVASSAQTMNAGKLTIKQMIVEVLGLMPEGAEALEILDHINKRFDAGLERTSLSPQLSRLKKERVIDRTGLRWSLNEKGPAEAGPSMHLGSEAGARGAATHQRPDGSIPSESTSVKEGQLSTAADLHIHNPKGGLLM